MRDEKREAFIFSVHNTDKSTMENVEAHTNLVNYLKRENYSYKELITGYTTETGQDMSENSVYIQTDDNRDVNELFDFVHSQCQNAHQQFFLQIDASREARLTPLYGETQSIGVLTPVSRDEAYEADSYTFCPLTGNYFICK